MQNRAETLSFQKPRALTDQKFDKAYNCRVILWKVKKILNSLDIIIINHNSTDYLLECLKSINASLGKISAGIYVEDNASDDDAERIKLKFPKVILSGNSSNRGFAGAVNSALKKSSAPYVVLLNPDTRVTHGFFESVLVYMEDRPEVGIMGPEILNSDGSIQGSARSFPNFITAFFGRKSLLTRWFPRSRPARQSILTHISDGISPMAVDWISGACMVVRKKAIDDVGFLDERFFLYWEDADWCKRMWNAGWKVVYCPMATVVHHVGGSSVTLPFRSNLEFHKNCYRLYSKYARFPLTAVSPLVFGCIAMRFFLVLAAHKFKGIINRRSEGKTPSGTHGGY